MPNIIAKQEIIDILKEDGIVFTHSTKNSKYIMMNGDYFHQFADELSELFKNDGLIPTNIPVNLGEYERIYYLNSRISFDTAKSLAQQFYENLYKYK